MNKVEKNAAKEEKKAEPDLMEVLMNVSKGLESLTDEMSTMKKKMADIETGGVNKFMAGAKAEDIATASESRDGVDPKIIKIVDEMLGTDFKVEVKAMGDRPGLRFSVIVPPRLSDNVTDRKPVLELDENGFPTGKYKKDLAGNTVMEDYMPEDRRSCVLSSVDSYETIRKHCERVRGYIIAHFQKTNQPLPEFKLK